jgi:hypothetical protein
MIEFLVENERIEKEYLERFYIWNSKKFLKFWAFHSCLKRQSFSEGNFHWGFALMKRRKFRWIKQLVFLLFYW